MKFEERLGNLFDVDEKYYLAHCISSDLGMGAGIAVEFQARFKLRESLRKMAEQNQSRRILDHPTCVLVDRVFNLITKAKYWHKPTLLALKSSVRQMKTIAVKNDIKYIAMPTIGCGIDRLRWSEVKEIIKKTFEDTDIEILVCYLEETD